MRWERRQRVQTLTCLERPGTAARTVCKFGIQARRDLLLAWLTLLPITMPLPQTAQTRATGHLPPSKKNRVMRTPVTACHPITAGPPPTRRR